MLAGLSKGYVRPPKWTPATFASDGEAMIRVLVRTAQTVKAYAYPTVVKIGLRVMKGQMERTIGIALGREKSFAGWSTKVAIEVAAHEELWLEALNEVFAETGGELVAELIPPIRSVGAQAESKTREILGAPENPHAGMNVPVQKIASRITGIDEGTRDRFRRIIVREIQNGSTPADVARVLRQTMDGWPARRLATIARTELSNAFNHGSIEAMRSIPNLISIDVIGCQSREMERWEDPSYQQFMFQGESTCNIQGVAIQDAHLLNFHPNHTGVIVPSEFRDSEGNVTTE